MNKTEQHRQYHKQSNLYYKNQFHSNYKIDEHILKTFPKNGLPTDPTKKSKTYHLLQQIKNLQPNYF